MTRCSDAEGAAAAAGWKALLLGGALLLTALTVLNFLALERYQPTGPAIALLPQGGVTLVNDDPGRIERADFAVPLPPETAFVRIRAIAEADGIAPGRRPWQRGRIVFVKRDADGKGRWDLPHVVALLKGDTGREIHEAVFAASRSADRLELRIELLRATGRLGVAAATATPMREAPGFRPAANFLAGAWLLLAITVSVWALRRVRRRRWLIGLCWLVGAVALGLSVAPGEATSPARTVAVHTVDLVASRSAGAKEKQAALSANNFSIAKAGHVLMFFCVGIAFALARGRSGPVRIFLLAAAFAALCEMMQLFSPNRSPALFDLMLNVGSASAGYWIGLAALALLWRLAPALRGDRAI